MSGFNILKNTKIATDEIFIIREIIQSFLLNLCVHLRKRVFKHVQSKYWLNKYFFIFHFSKNKCYQVFFSKYTWLLNGIEKKFLLLLDQLGKILSHPRGGYADRYGTHSPWWCPFFQNFIKFSIWYLGTKLQGGVRYFIEHFIISWYWVPNLNVNG